MQHTAGRVFRAVTAVAAFATAFYTIGYFFSWTNTPSRWVQLWLVALAINLPLALIPGLGLRLRQGFARAGLIIGLASLLALGYLSMEAELLMRPAITRGEAGYAQRHWPFGNSSVHFSPGAGTFWQD